MAAVGQDLPACLSTLPEWARARNGLSSEAGVRTQTLSRTHQRLACRPIGPGQGAWITHSGVQVTEGGVRCPGVPGAQQEALSGAPRGPPLPSEAEGPLLAVPTALCCLAHLILVHRGRHTSPHLLSSTHAPVIAFAWLPLQVGSLLPCLLLNSSLLCPLGTLFHCSGHAKQSFVSWCLCARVTAFEVDTAWTLTIPGRADGQRENRSALTGQSAGSVRAVSQPSPSEAPSPVGARVGGGGQVGALLPRPPPTWLGTPRFS